MCDLSRPEFHDADKAREWLEARVWKNGHVCPHCGVVDQSTLMKGKSHRPGLYQCNGAVSLMRIGLRLTREFPDARGLRLR